MTGPNSTGTSKNLIKGHKEKKKNKSKESERKWLKWKTQKRLNLPPGVSEEENENRLELVFKTIIQEDLKKKDMNLHVQGENYLRMSKSKIYTCKTMTSKIKRKTNSQRFH